MVGDPRYTHDVDQIRAEFRELASVVAQHKKDLVEAGMDEAEAFALAQTVEEKWAETIFGNYGKKKKARALEDVLDIIEEEIDRVTGDM